MTQLAPPESTLSAPLPYGNGGGLGICVELIDELAAEVEGRARGWTSALYLKGFSLPKSNTASFDAARSLSREFIIETRRASLRMLSPLFDFVWKLKPCLFISGTNTK